MVHDSKDLVDSAIDDTENEVEEKKRGPRARYFFCAAIGEIQDDDDESHDGIIHEPIRANSEVEARAIFKKKYSLDAEICEDGSSVVDGNGSPIGGTGFYVAMGTGMTTAQRVSVTVTPEQLMRRTSKAIKAKLTIDGRKHNLFGSGLKALDVKVNGEVQKYNDNDLFSVEFEDSKDANGKKIPKPKLKKREVIRFADLEDIQVIS